MEGGETPKRKEIKKMTNINLDNLIREMREELNAICGEAADAEDAAREEGWKALLFFYYREIVN